MIGVLLALAAALVSVLAFPPFGPGWLIVLGVALFLTALRKAQDRRWGLALGAIYGLGFFGGLIWWISELGLIAVVPLILVMAIFWAVLGWWLAGFTDRSAPVWFLLAVGGWAVMELIRYHFPVGGFEWGAAGYALSDHVWTRAPASFIGTSGLTVVVVMIAATLAVLADRSFRWPVLIPFGVLGLILGVLAIDLLGGGIVGTGPGPVYIVQGSTPCPYEHCPDERLLTFEQHLALTETIEGETFLVVWSEGSTGGSDADPVQNAEIGQAIGEQVRRLHAWFLVGSDRPLDDETWVNANILFNPDGEIVAEYHKQHPVPFGEYIPFRPLFDWIPALAAVPRDMIPGDGPVVFDLGEVQLGSVISFEGGFSRYARRQVEEGANLIVVATNEGSYGLTPASDQFIGMTRMRAVELGVDVIHSAVTGKSVFIESNGELLTSKTGLATMEVLGSDVDVPNWAANKPTPYTRYGDVVLWLAALTAVVVWWRDRR